MVDECLPYKVATMLKNCGYEVLDVAKSSFRGLKDSELVGIARKGDYVIITKDVGYSIIGYKKLLPGLWLIRTPNTFRAEMVVKLLKEFIEKENVEELKGKTVVISPGKVRIRPI